MRSAAERRTLRVRAPGAGAVEIAADFTDWRPVMLAREGDDWWTITRAIPAGPRQLNVRTNGGPWLVPRGATPVADEFGGTVGVIQLP